jgi:hypothetical protein
VTCSAYQQGVPAIDPQKTDLSSTSTPPFSSPCVTAAFAFGILSILIGTPHKHSTFVTLSLSLPSTLHFCYACPSLNPPLLLRFPFPHPISRIRIRLCCCLGPAHYTNWFLWPCSPSRSVLQPPPPPLHLTPPCRRLFSVFNSQSPHFLHPHPRRRILPIQLPRLLGMPDIAQRSDSRCRFFPVELWNRIPPTSRVVLHAVSSRNHVEPRALASGCRGLI